METHSYKRALSSLSMIIIEAKKKKRSLYFIKTLLLFFRAAFCCGCFFLAPDARAQVPTFTSHSTFTRMAPNLDNFWGCFIQEKNRWPISTGLLN